MSVALRRRLWDLGVPAVIAGVSLLTLYVNNVSSPRFEFRGSRAANADCRVRG
jgi:hypothetical protein